MSLSHLIDTALLAFTTLFTMVNPLGIIPLYTSVTSDLSPDEAKATAKKAVIIATITMMIFGIGGKFIFDFFQISVNSLKVVGGVIFFMVGYDMLQARGVRTKSTKESEAEADSDIAITPLAIPLLCGPGAITGSIVLMNDTTGIMDKIVLLGMMVVVMFITLLILLSGRKITKFLGPSGNKVLMRIMGLIVMVIAVEFFFAGVGKFLKDTLITVGLV